MALDYAKNIRNVRRTPDGAFRCEIDMHDNFTKEFISTTYCAREGDKSPINLWILSEIATDNYSITEMQVAPQTPGPTGPTGSGGPTVVV
jgi:hypothetical protein